MIEKISVEHATTGQSIDIHTKVTKYVLSTINFGQIAATHNTYQFIDRTGVYVSGTSLSSRDINIEGYIVGKDVREIGDLKYYLNRFVNPYEYFYIHYNGYKMLGIPYHTIQYGVSYTENNEVYCKFYMDFLAPAATFLLKDAAITTGVGINPLFHFPLWFKESEEQVVFGMRYESLIFESLNDGDLDIGCIIEFECLNGEIDSPYVINIRTQEIVTINKVLLPGEKVVINTKPGQLSVTGTYENVESDYFRYWSIDNSWLKIYKGINTLRYGAITGEDQLKVEVRYEPEWFEVQTYD